MKTATDSQHAEDSVSNSGDCSRALCGASGVGDCMSQLVRTILRKWLEHEMSDISEDHYAAGWMSGLEYELWDAVCRLPKTTDYGMGTIDVERLEKIRDVSELLNEWCDGDKFIPLSEWREMVGAPKTH